MELKQIKNKIRQSLTKLYKEDAVLFERNDGDGLCERCLMFRFAMYLQEAFEPFYVDCDLNSSQDIEKKQPINKSLMMNPDGTMTERYVDIVIHKRTWDAENDFICFEAKKWNNKDKKAAEKDRNNLIDLTRRYGYHYGFFLVLGRTLEKTRWEIYQNGKVQHELHYVE